MPFTINPKSKSAVMHNTKVKKYPDGSTSITYCKTAIFRDLGEEAVKSDDLQEKIKESSCEKSNRDRTEELLRRHREIVRDIAIMNEFKYFLTITINPEKLDSFDVNAVKRKLQRWLKNMQLRKGLKYLLIPEYHKSGRIHCHALVNDVLRLEDSGKRAGEKIIYNCPEWRYGFTTAIPLDDNKLRISNYITKYITKGSDKIFGKYYWSSKNILRTPEVSYTDTDYGAVNAVEYQPLENYDELAFKYESSLMLQDKKEVKQTPIIFKNSNGVEMELNSVDELIGVLQENSSGI